MMTSADGGFVDGNCFAWTELEISMMPALGKAKLFYGDLISQKKKKKKSFRSRRSPTCVADSRHRKQNGILSGRHRMKSGLLIAQILTHRNDELPTIFPLLFYIIILTFPSFTLTIQS
ncbi:unnamed protein product [Prunus brigantina]